MPHMSFSTNYKVKLEHAFQTWRSATIQCLYYKESVRKADELCRVLIQKKCLQAWMKYHTLCQRKMVSVYVKKPYCLTIMAVIH